MKKFSFQPLSNSSNMEWNGVPIDENKRYEFYKECDKRLGELSREIRKDSGRIDLNPNTPKSIEDYFFKQKKYKLDKKTAGGSQSTDKSVLSDIARIYNDKVAEKILNYKELTKLQSTYVEGLSKHIYDDKRMHGGYNLTVDSNRSGPHLQILICRIFRRERINTFERSLLRLLVISFVVLIMDKLRHDFSRSLLEMRTISRICMRVMIFIQPKRNGSSTKIWDGRWKMRRR